MKPNYRSFAGLAVAAIVLPAIIGIVACIPVLPVPIGNPEKSRVDPEMAGVWFEVAGENLWLLEPYDRRTYLVTLYDFSPVDCMGPSNEPRDEADESDGGHDSEEETTAAAVVAAGAAGDADSGPEVVLEEIIVDSPYRPEGYEGDFDAEAAFTWYKSFMIAVRQDCEGEAAGREVYKAWLTRLGRRDFLTFEVTGAFAKDGGFVSPEEGWFVWRISRPAEAAIALDLVTPDFEGFEGIKETRKAFESVIRKHAANPELTIGEPLLLLRVPRHDLEFFGESIDPAPVATLLEFM